MGDVTREMDALAFEGDDLREALRKEHARVAELERELGMALRTIEEAGAEFYCACCGETSPDLPAMMAHLAVCPKHPLRAAERALAEREAEVAELREALYPLVVGCLTADANEDAPEFVNDEAYVGRRALPECGRCCGSGSTDGTEYVDVAIPEALRCPDCGGWGFLKSAPGSSDALRAHTERTIMETAREIVRRGDLLWKFMSKDGAEAESVSGSLYAGELDTMIMTDYTDVDDPDFRRLVARLLGDARGETTRVDAETEGDEG